MMVVQPTPYLGVLCSRKDVIELLLQRLPLSQRPVGVFLVHKDDILQDSLRQEKAVRHEYRAPGMHLGGARFQALPQQCASL